MAEEEKRKTPEIEDFDLEDEDADREFDADEDESDADLIARIVREEIEENNKVINTRFDSLELRTTNLEKMVTNLAGLKAEKAKIAVVADDTEKSGLDKFLDATLGTTGRALHAVVDTVAFVGESLVDVVTLNRAKNKG